MCYPVIGLNKDNYYIHKTSPENLLDDKYEEYKDRLSVELSTADIKAPTFIWHNFDDSAVNVVNSLRYAENLKNRGALVEMHIFPEGGHGVGLPDDDSKISNHIMQWIDLLIKWLKYHEFME